jgi:hypothetical protein
MTKGGVKKVKNFILLNWEPLNHQLETYASIMFLLIMIQIGGPVSIKEMLSYAQCTSGHSS